jgi:hypothetical protein
MWGFVAKAGGWLIAHKDAIYAGFKTFKVLRGRRKETQLSGESPKDYYLRKAKEVIKSEYKRMDVD